MSFSAKKPFFRILLLRWFFFMDPVLMGEAELSDITGCSWKIADINGLVRYADPNAQI